MSLLQHNTSKSNELKWHQSGEMRNAKLPLEAVCYQAGEQVRSVCILLHGFGDDAQNFIAIAKEFAPPGSLCVALNAPMPLKHMGFSQGRAWFDLFAMPWNDIHAAQSKVLESAEILLDTVGLPSSKLVFIGFSQGGFMSLLCGLTLEARAQQLTSLTKTPGAIVSLSGFLMGSHRLPAPSNAAQKIPIFIGHGSHDQVVLPLWYYETVDLLKLAGYEKIEYHSYPAAHTIDSTEMNDLRIFLKGLI